MNEGYKQHGRIMNEISLKYRISSQKCGTPRHYPQIVTKEKNEYLVENSSDGDDPQRPEKDIEKSDNFPITNKRKRHNNQQETKEYIPGEYILLENMELDANIGEIEFSYDEQRIQPSDELVIQEPKYYEEEYLTLHNALFDKYLKKLVFEFLNSRGKKIKYTEVDLNKIVP